jgi:chemotaxis family two-component system response regulator Rcp1
MGKAISILMVEDNQGDVLLTEEILNDGKFSNELNAVSHGEAAIEYLEDAKQGKHTLPDLILMDINLPRLNGHEVISYIRQDDALKDTPIFIVSSSRAPADLEKSRPLVQHYLVKPMDLMEFEKGIRKVEQFFFSIIRTEK